MGITGLAAFQSAGVLKESMKKTLTITTHEAQLEADRAFWRERTPEERLDAVERFRLEAGRFLYEYPTRLRRVLEVTRDTSS